MAKNPAEMFATKYFERYKTEPKMVSTPPPDNLQIVVVIPCFDEPNIIDTLHSLDTAKSLFIGGVEVIVVVNSAENSSKESINRNKQTFEILQKFSPNNFYLHTLLIEGVNKKYAGVGNARKIGMDEALRRFDSLERPKGIITSLDADCLVSEEYFTQIATTLEEHQATTLNFSHTLPSNNTQKEACMLYECYLRYFRIALQQTGFPNAIHTIGSCFALKAELYAKSGGMPRLQAGEDFYFLHKIAQITPIFKINKPLVFPSGRFSDRVPFGTGRAIDDIASKGEYMVYPLRNFYYLKDFFRTIPQLFYATTTDIFPHKIIEFYEEKALREKIDEVRCNTKSLEAFSKRFFSIFDAFFAIKFLNSLGKTQPILEACREILTINGISFENNLKDIFTKITKFDQSL